MNQYLKDNKNTIIVGIFIVFLIVPVAASLSYAEFVEHLWSIQSDLQYNGYVENDQIDNVLASSPSSNTISIPNDDDKIGIEHVQGMIVFGGIFGISIFLICLSNRKEKRSHNMPKKYNIHF